MGHIKQTKCTTYNMFLQLFLKYNPSCERSVMLHTHTITAVSLGHIHITRLLVSSVEMLCMFGAGQRFASCRVASVILCRRLLRTVDRQSITSAFWTLLVILQTRLLGFIFTAFMICLSLTAVFSADQVVVGCWCFLHALCFCCSSNWLPLFF